MKGKDRRKHRRLRIRVPVSYKTGIFGDQQVTNNISSGGLYIHVPSNTCPRKGSVIDFELQMPPGEGYSIFSGTIRGAGKIVRIDALPRAQAGLAVQFTNPLALDF